MNTYLAHVRNLGGWPVSRLPNHGLKVIGRDLATIRSTKEFLSSGFIAKHLFVFPFRRSQYRASYKLRPNQFPGLIQDGPRFGTGYALTGVLS
jgi:hypothetical protein